MIRIARLSSQQTPPYSLDPEDLEFGRTCTPNFFVSEYRGGKWLDPRIEALHDFELHPAANIFHYGQGVFEGLKAYRQPDGELALFRPVLNAKRFAESAIRMAMPTIDEEFFLEAIQRLVEIERAFVPHPPGTLYIRPTMIGTEPCLGVRSSTDFLFYIITLPSGGYFKDMKGGTRTLKVFVSQSDARAAEGGTGGVKAAANYAVTLKSIGDAKHRGCDQVLFLDGARHQRVEELGGMNIFFVRDGELITPTLSGTILPGVTRDSLLTLGPDLGIPAREVDIEIEQVFEEVRSGRIAEAIACGTAATVIGLSEFLFEDGRQLIVADGKVGPITRLLFDQIQAIQFGTAADRFGWRSLVSSDVEVGSGQT